MDLSCSENLFASFSGSCHLLKSLLKSHPKVPKLHFNVSNRSDCFSHVLISHDEQSNGWKVGVPIPAYLSQDRAGHEQWSSSVSG